ncbi:MAG: SCO family protein [Gammaproteobacteria bacterium]
MADERGRPVDDLDRATALRGRVPALAVGTLVLTVGMALAIVYALAARWQVLDGRVGEIPQPRGPQHEVAPQPQLEAYLRRKRERLESYGWVDRDAGIAHIPIDEAMRLMVDERAGDLRRPRGQDLSALMPIASAEAAPPVLAFEQRSGAQLPLDLRYVDARGRRVALGDYFGADPVVLVLGYYECPRLCSTLMDGVLLGLREVDLPYRVVGVSIDPRETADIAARRQAAYARLTPAVPALLTGDAASIRRLADTVGYAYRYDAVRDEYAHPAGFVVATPGGRVSRYFFGVRYAPRDLHLALVEASAGRLGSLADRLVLLCSHYDPQTGRYSGAVMQLARALAALVILALVAIVWRARRTRRQA